MGPAFGTILRQVRKNRHTKIICLADNVIPHEKRPGDKPFTRYFLQACDGFVTMSQKVMTDLRTFEQNKPALFVPHPLYDNFGTPLLKEEARKALALPPSGRIVLFFGFIRHYKGLDLLLKAMAEGKVKDENIRLVVAGEFYEDEEMYRQLIKKNRLDETVILKTSFIPDDQVRFYFSAADCVIQPYRNATQSGVTPLAYHFEKPMIVTNVGGLPALVPHLKVGLVAEPTVDSLADALVHFYQKGEDFFIPNIRSEKKKYSWESLVNAITAMAASVRL
jgi:glycosyltransferase involved in cell wall biosynthesis